MLFEWTGTIKHIVNRTGKGTVNITPTENISKGIMFLACARNTTIAEPTVTTSSGTATLLSSVLAPSSVSDVQMTVYAYEISNVTTSDTITISGTEANNAQGCMLFKL